MLGAMNKLTATVLAAAAICALALPAGAAAAKPVRYVGKTSAGHMVTFGLIRGKKVDRFVTNFEVTSKKLRNGTITGHLRRQYEFLVPKYTPGTFSIYSCLGEATFKAKPA